MVMRISIQSLALTGALLWGGCLLLLGLGNLAVPTYGGAFLQGISSVYPGFHHVHTLGDIFVDTLYGAIDGALAGALVAWLYNTFSRAGSA
jgi:hypothetical protein